MHSGTPIKVTRLLTNCLHRKRKEKEKQEIQEEEEDQNGNLAGSSAQANEPTTRATLDPLPIRVPHRRTRPI